MSQSVVSSHQKTRRVTRAVEASSPRCERAAASGLLGDTHLPSSLPSSPSQRVCATVRPRIKKINKTKPHESPRLVLSRSVSVEPPLGAGGRFYARCDAQNLCVIPGALSTSRVTGVAVAREPLERGTCLVFRVV